MGPSRTTPKQALSRITQIAHQSAVASVVWWRTAPNVRTAIAATIAKKRSKPAAPMRPKTVRTMLCGLRVVNSADGSG